MVPSSVPNKFPLQSLAVSTEKLDNKDEIDNDEKGKLSI